MSEQNDELMHEAMTEWNNEVHTAEASSGGNSLKHCCGDDKMCTLTCCPCHIDLGKIIGMVNNPKFICKSCGRVANEEKSLCQPISFIALDSPIDDALLEKMADVMMADIDKAAGIK